MNDKTFAHIFLLFSGFSLTPFSLSQYFFGRCHLLFILRKQQYCVITDRQVLFVFGVQGSRSLHLIKPLINVIQHFIQVTRNCVGCQILNCTGGREHDFLLPSWIVLCRKTKFNADYILGYLICCRVCFHELTCHPR